MHFIRFIAVITVFFFLTFSAEAQVAINNTGDQPNSSAMLDVSSTSKGILIPRMTEAQRNAISNPAEGLMIYQTNNEPGYYYHSQMTLPWGWKKVANGDETKIYGIYNIKVTGSGRTGDPYHITAGTHYIGEHFGGGIVFYVYDGGMHGLIASLTDLSEGIPWYNGTYKFTGTPWIVISPYVKGGGLLGGIENTTLIMSSQYVDNPSGNFAAKLCSDYVAQDEGDYYLYYGDWYLPSLFELGLLYDQKATVGITSGIYWSSNETDSYMFNAYGIDFSNGYDSGGDKGSPYKVRAIRSF